MGYTIEITTIEVRSAQHATMLLNNTFSKEILLLVNTDNTQRFERNTRKIQLNKTVYHRINRLHGIESTCKARPCVNVEIV